MVKQNEQDILQQLKAGSNTAFKNVYNDNRELFLNFGRKYGLGNDDLLDIYQDTYIALYQNIATGKLKKMKSTISTYLIGIGKYKIMDMLRKNKKQVNHEGILSIATDENIDFKELEFYDDPMDSQELKLKKCIETLGAKCQEILKMYYYQSLNIKEIMIAGNYNTENVVKSQKSRCMKQLRLCYKN